MRHEIKGGHSAVAAERGDGRLTRSLVESENGADSRQRGPRSDPDSNG